jgi:hypothetical protein
VKIPYLTLLLIAVKAVIKPLKKMASPKLDFYYGLGKVIPEESFELAISTS